MADPGDIFGSGAESDEGLSNKRYENLFTAFVCWIKYFILKIGLLWLHTSYSDMKWRTLLLLVEEIQTNSNFASKLKHVEYFI